VIIYIEEAHPAERWKLPGDVCYKQPSNLQQRVDIGRDLINNFNVKTELWVDFINNNCAKAYSAYPERVFVIDNGRIVFLTTTGPFGYDLQGVREFLTEYCQRARKSAAQ